MIPTALTTADAERTPTAGLAALRAALVSRLAGLTALPMDADVEYDYECGEINAYRWVLTQVNALLADDEEAPRG